MPHLQRQRTEDRLLSLHEGQCWGWGLWVSDLSGGPWALERLPPTQSGLGQGTTDPRVT
jgi:hypothetical protein